MSHEVKDGGAAVAHHQKPDAHLSKVKLAFLYVLIASLVASALTAVIALIIGELNEAILKALGTVFIFFTHSLFVLAIVWADTHNRLGKALISTSILAVTVLNMLTATLGIWGVITGDLMWRLTGLYFLILAAVFLITGAMKLTVKNTAVQSLVYATIGLVVVQTLALVPWVLNLFGNLDSLYFRIVSAITIVAATTFLTALILRGIVVARQPALKVKQASTEPAVSGGMVAIYVTIGTITSIVIFAGLIGFLVSATQSALPDRTDYRGGSSRYS